MDGFINWSATHWCFFTSITTCSPCAFSFCQGCYFCVKQYALECSRIPMGQTVNSQVNAWQKSALLCGYTTLSCAFSSVGIESMKERWWESKRNGWNTKWFKCLNFTCGRADVLVSFYTSGCTVGSRDVQGPWGRFGHQLKVWMFLDVSLGLSGVSLQHQSLISLYFFDRNYCN